ncbi:MAG: putative Xaa-Pro aminopeptidase [Candidatus Saccharibacteria bacterium]|nr:putative Xaa-Pro aminopeptidase [Candidatus Saccharibacteria bacterium]
MKSSFFLANRKSLASTLDGGLVVLSANSQMQRGNDAAFAFEQESNFWYLCGIEESDWWLIVDGTRGKSWLVAPEVDSVHQTFEGSLPHDEALKISGANDVISRDDALKLLRELAKKHSVVYTLGEHPQKDHFSFVENPAQKKLTAVLERTFSAVQDCRRELAQLRAIKQPEEIAAMKKAIRLTTQAFTFVKEKLPELKYEYEVEAEFDYYFKQHGASHAYDPIVAHGKHACTLHYAKNDAKLKKNTLLLMDIGARYGGYSADVTRTHALGTPTRRQVEIHAAVEQAHREIVQLLKPGLTISSYHAKVEDSMKRVLVRIGLLKDLQDEATYRMYFPHAISHGLGIDTHDPLGAPEVFLEGMVLTVEPGIYIPKEGIGVRIEDDILITKTGHDNLSGRLSTGL